MILLDTNVVSEAMKPEPHPSVRDWLDAPGGRDAVFPQRHHRRTVVRHPRAAARVGRKKALGQHLDLAAENGLPTSVLRLTEEWHAAAAGHRHADAAEDDDRDHADRDRCWSA